MMELNVASTGRFSIVAHGGAITFAGGEVRVGNLSSSAGSLIPVGGLKQVSGDDELGPWHGVRLAWAGATSQRVLVRTTFQQYVGDSDFVVFEQYFPEKIEFGKDVPTETAPIRSRTLFPSFDRGLGPSDALPCFSYNDVMAQMRSCTFGTYRETHQGGVPLVMYNRTNSSLPMVVFSPLDRPKAQHVGTDQRVVGIGVKATAESIPAGWSQRALLSAGVGINVGMRAWGDLMLRSAGQPRTDHRYRDTVHSTIGFWTDNGGYYHYSTGGNETYEVVLPKVHAYHQSLGVRFGHWQFDSWFYPKDGSVLPGGGGGGVTNWTALASVFPSGMAAIQQQLGVPMVMHNRQWSPSSAYINDTALPYTWLSGPDWTIPRDPDGFFRWFFTQQQGWGLSMYEQVAGP
jgi:hypothetical protein